MADQMLIRIDADLKARLNRLARAEGKTTSQMVRELIRDYVKERDIGAYIDGLWERIGTKLTARGVRPADINKAIRETRKGRG
jgi:metal-responsive CopG/Arc/MetJ family transcriptional regulator